MPICGAKTNDNKQCQRRVSQPGQRCHIHLNTDAGPLLKKIISVCQTVTTIAGTAEAVHWVYQHAWPHIQPIFDANLFCPEHFWWDGVAAPAQGDRPIKNAPDDLKKALKEMQDRRTTIEREVLSNYSPEQRERIADAYERVLSEIREHYPNLVGLDSPDVA